MFKLFASPCACADEFFAMVTEDVVHGVHKVVTLSCFSITQRQKVSEGFTTVLPLYYKFAYEPQMVVEGQGHFPPKHITTGYTVCNVMVCAGGGGGGGG